MIKWIVFDLDNTLYDEEQYVLACYQEIARQVDPNKTEEITRFLLNERKQNGDSLVFQRLIRSYRLPGYEIERFISIYHTFDVPIKFFDDVSSFFENAQHCCRYAILTNGSEQTQKNKCRLLEAYRMVDKIMITGEYLNRQDWKPAPKAYQLLCEQINTSASDCLFVGDSIKNDIEGALRVGMKACLINRSAEQGISQQRGYMVIRSFQYLPEVVEYFTQ